jgi:5-methylthioadenosine/S-adenosylhomocysteine deaminase
MSISKYLRAIIVLLLMTSTSAPLAANASQRRRTRADIIISGATIVTMDNERRVIEDGSVVVSGGRIVAVGQRAEIEAKYIGRETIDGHGKVVIPGLINGHTHVPMTLFRGLADDLDLQEWLTKYIFPAEAKNVSEEFVRVGTRLGLAEMIRGGTTTYCDMYYFEDAIADETSKAGVRGLLGETVIDFPVADNKTWPEAMAYAERFVKKWKGNPLITPAIAPHAPYTVSEEHLKAVRALSDRLGAPVVIHVSETRREVEDSLKSKGALP